MRKHYDNNRLWYEEPVNENGQLHGTMRVYYQNGQLMYEKQYRNGQLHGAMYHWDSYGELRWKAFHLYGKEVDEEEYKRHTLIEKISGVE